MSAPTGGATVTDRCELLGWDSEFFGIRIARLEADRLDTAEVEAVLHWCENQRVDCLYFLAGGDHRDTARAVEARSFDRVDVRVDLSHTLAGITEAELERAGVRHASEPDLAALTTIARDSFTASRFFFDGRFPRDRVATLYETWVVRALAGELAEAVLVVELDGAAVGFVTCGVDSAGAGRIGLLGVSAAARGRGVGTQLCRAALGWFAGGGATRATVTTQERSGAALRLYEQCGFTTSSVGVWYHRWFDRREP